MKLAKINWKNSIYLLTVTLPVFLIDFFTKNWALTLKGKEGIVVFESWWNFIYVENKGALWGLGANFPDSVRQLIFLGFSTLITILVLYLLLAFAETKFMKIIYALIVAGAFGNLYDRFFRGFAVIDFIDWHAGEIYHWPTFNIADVAIVVAIFLLAFELLFLQPKCQKDKKEAK
jgi:signal peptidase II